MPRQHNTQRDALRSSWKDTTIRLVRVMMGASPPGHVVVNDPARQARYTDRPQLGVSLTLPRQNLANGRATKQAGAGRAIIPAYVALAPSQSLTRMPDGRIIARRMPTAAVDERQVVGGR